MTRVNVPNFLYIYKKKHFLSEQIAKNLDLLGN